jgi:hypothetical protein
MDKAAKFKFAKQQMMVFAGFLLVADQAARAIDGERARGRLRRKSAKRKSAKQQRRASVSGTVAAGEGGRSGEVGRRSGEVVEWQSARSGAVGSGCAAWCGAEWAVE